MTDLPSDPLRAALEALGGPDDARDPATLIEAFDGTLRKLEAIERRPRPFSEAWAELSALRAKLGAEDPRTREDALKALRGLVDATRADLRLPPPARPMALAHEIAFRGAHPVDNLVTPFPTINKFTYGGLWDQRLIVIAGEPNVGKTALMMQIAGRACELGCAVAIHASDVDKRPDISARLGVARGVDRAALRRCDPDAQALTREIMRPWALKIVDQWEDDFTLEDTIEALLELGRQNPGRRLLLFVDSLQTAICRALLGVGAPRYDKEKIEAVTKALLVATRQGITVIATSEVPRNFYSGKAIDQPSDMAAVKGSGRVEFALWSLFVLRRRRGEAPGAFHLGMPKNKGGVPEGAIDLRYDSELGVFEDLGELPYESKAKGEKKARAEDQDALNAKIETTARKAVPHLVRALAEAGREGLGKREIRERLAGKSAAKDRAITIALADKLAVMREIKGYPRYYTPSSAPPDPTPAA